MADSAPYFWAGGRLSSDKRTLTWENGRSEGIRKGQHPWSFTGSRGAQPDGGPGSEQCLAVLNNFYNVSLFIHFRFSLILFSLNSMTSRSAKLIVFLGPQFTNLRSNLGITCADKNAGYTSKCP